jgi:hypothetical protein
MVAVVRDSYLYLTMVSRREARGPILRLRSGHGCGCSSFRLVSEKSNHRDESRFFLFYNPR